MFNNKTVLAICLVVIMCLTGCTKTLGYGFKVTTGDNITIDVITSNDFTPKMSDDGAYMYVNKEDKPVFQVGFLDKNKIALDDVVALSKGTCNGNEFVSYAGDVDYLCYLVDVKNSSTIVQFINSGNFKDDVAEAAFKSTLVYLADTKAPKAEYNVTSEAPKSEDEEPATKDEKEEPTAEDEDRSIGEGNNGKKDDDQFGTVSANGDKVTVSSVGKAASTFVSDSGEANCIPAGTYNVSVKSSDLDSRIEVSQDNETISYEGNEITDTITLNLSADALVNFYNVDLELIK